MALANWYPQERDRLRSIQRLQCWNYSEEKPAQTIPTKTNKFRKVKRRRKTHVAWKGQKRQAKGKVISIRTMEA